MPLFRKKPVVIEAVEFMGWERGHGGSTPKNDWPSDWPSNLWPATLDEDRLAHGLSILTLEGEMRAEPGDWIIRGVKGEFYPCKPDIFAATYEAA